MLVKYNSTSILHSMDV